MKNIFIGINNKAIIKPLIQHIFVVSFALYFVLIVLEWWQSGFVSFYFNPDVVIFIAILGGLGLAITL